MSDTIHSSLKTAAKGTTLVFAGMIASQALWFGTRLLVVRNLSKEDLGSYTLIIAIISVLSLLASLGLWQGATRYISVFSGEGRKKDADAIHRSSVIIGAAAGSAACLLLILFSGTLSRYVFYKPDLSTPLIIISFFVPAYVLAMIFGSVLRGYGNIGPTVYFIEVGQPLVFLVLLCLTFLAGFSFMGIVYSYVFSILIACGTIALYLYKTEAGLLPARAGGDYGMELLKFSVPVLSIDIMFLLFRWTDTLILGRYATAEQVGVYGVAVSLAVLLNLPLVALGFVYLPLAGELYAKRRLSDLARTYQVLTKWVFSITLPIFFVLFFFPGMTITFLFGDRFADSAMPLRILSIGYLVTTFMGANSMLLLVLGLSRPVMKISAAGALFDALLNYVLVKHLGLGIVGASMATSVSLITVSLGYSCSLYRNSGMHPLSSGYLRPAFFSAVIGAAIYAAAKSLPLHFWLLPVYFLLYVTGYIALLIFTKSLDAEDFFLLGDVLMRAGFAPETAKKIIAVVDRK